MQVHILVFTPEAGSREGSPLIADLKAVAEKFRGTHFYGYVWVYLCV
jgi:hypothetical protein